ncbi:hypothetical protein CY34DRAFT_16827 [Suillus luteus UH-Slu-Lm8-n1]|uniref:Unplaced genomic scaffold CY34scaffold_460, whole genome shotgun sequence n=1 Tax=Suillus luteus UH-Slu-Lm8-n1 TaxID=930992 RepID=A0A0D0A1W0_9AGAM|nr:hypothetical protein CY34DRAFT_16827 [Suillus luteus UH-Slu-Lm8-n1]
MANSTIVKEDSVFEIFEFVAEDEGKGIGVVWDLGATEALRAELEHQTLLLVPASDSSESSDSDSEDDQTIPIELTHAQVLSIKERAKNKLQHIMLQKKEVTPMCKKHAQTVKKALKVSRIGHVKYMSFETQRVKEEMDSWMSNIHHMFKDYTIYNIQKDLSLCLLIEQQGAEVLHKKRLVPTLLESLNFLHKFAYCESGTLVCYVFEADWFVNMIIEYHIPQ